VNAELKAGESIKASSKTPKSSKSGSSKKESKVNHILINYNSFSYTHVVTLEQVECVKRVKWREICRGGKNEER
jgi:hypothetical protein